MIINAKYLDGGVDANFTIVLGNEAYLSVYSASFSVLLYTERIEASSTSTKKQNISKFKFS